MKCRLFGAWQTYLCYIYFVGVFPSFSFTFCSCETLLYVVYSAPPDIAWLMGSIGSTPVTQSTLLCSVLSRWVCPYWQGFLSLCGQYPCTEKTQYLNCFLTFLLPILFLHSFFNACFHAPYANIAIGDKTILLCSLPFTASCSCSVVV